MYVCMYVCIHTCMYVCMHVCMTMYVCMFVYNEFTIKIYRFTHSLCTFLACTAHGAVEIVMEDSEDTRQEQARE